MTLPYKVRADAILKIVFERVGNEVKWLTCHFDGGEVLVEHFIGEFNARAYADGVCMKCGKRYLVALCFNDRERIQKIKEGVR